MGLADNTYVIYTTDNGPWLPFKHHGGLAGPLRDGKDTTFEGGDVGEQDNLAAAHPEIVARLRRRMADCDAEISRHARAPWVQPEAAVLAN